MPNVLTSAEGKELARLEAIIKKSLTTFIEVGTALMEIRESKLYRPHDTFEDYCKNRWGIGRTYAHRLMQATEIVGDLSKMLPSGNIPETESQARPLSKLPKEEQAAAWKEATETAPNGHVTAKHVEKVVQTRSERLGLNGTPAAPKITEREPGDDTDHEAESRKAALKEAKHPHDSPSGTPGLPKDVANALADTWHLECARLLSKMAKECKGAFTWSQWLDGSVLDHLKSAEQCFLSAAPRKVCPDCQGMKKVEKVPCQRCRHGGYLGAQQ